MSTVEILSYKKSKTKSKKEFALPPFKCDLLVFIKKKLFGRHDDSMFDKSVCHDDSPSLRAVARKVPPPLTKYSL